MEIPKLIAIRCFGAVDPTDSGAVTADHGRVPHRLGLRTGVSLIKINLHVIQAIRRENRSDHATRLWYLSGTKKVVIYTI